MQLADQLRCFSNLCSIIVAKLAHHCKITLYKLQDDLYVKMSTFLNIKDKNKQDGKLAHESDCIRV